MAAPATTERVIILSSDPNLLVITVHEPRKDGIAGAGAKFNLARDKVVQMSSFFRGCLAFNSSNAHNGPVLHDDNIQALHIWFLCMHGVAYADFDPSLKRNISIETIWHVIHAADKYLFDKQLGWAGQNFFYDWYTEHVEKAKLDNDFASQLAFPCHFFDHAEGFAKVTKWLAYRHPGHITEKKPISFKWKHLHLCPPDFVGPVNHARGSLKTTLHRLIWKDVGRVLKERKNYKCTGWAEVAGQYFAALTDTEVYPLELSFPKHSINELLDKLDKFTMSQPFHCTDCSWNWKEQMENTQIWTAGAFDGLCIDCMDKSNRKHEAFDKDYWQRLGKGSGGWDQDCRIYHGESTWYVSWCGRDEHRRKLVDEAGGRPRPWKRLRYS